MGIGRPMDTMMRLAPLLLLAVAAGCGGTAPPPPNARPPGEPPSPTSVTPSNPGGDSADPEAAALKRLLEEGPGFRRDYYKTLQVWLPDSKKWRRVRLWGQPTRATYRYGDKHYAVASVWYQPAKKGDDADACMAQFFDFATPIAESFDVKFGAPKVSRTLQSVDGAPRPMLVEVVDGSIDGLFKSDEYVGAVASYSSWPGTCLVQAFAVVATEHRDLAVQVRDRWVAEVAPKLRWEAKIKTAPKTDAR